jgi:hypothetical protein
MKNKVIVFIVPVILSILLTLYFTISGTSIITFILSPINGCGLLLGLANLALLTQPTLRFIIINVVLGILIFSLLYFGNKDFLKEYVTMGVVVGLITGVVGSLFIKKSSSAYLSDN